MQLPVGTIASRCRLDFSELGKLDVDLQVVGHWWVRHDDAAINHYGCVFVSPDGRMVDVNGIVRPLGRHDHSRGRDGGTTARLPASSARTRSSI